MHFVDISPVECHTLLTSLQAQRQSMSFAEAQSRQSRMLEEAQRQVGKYYITNNC